jgi:hypothetical protein
MNTPEFKGDWPEIKKKIRKEYAKLTSEDLKFAEIQKESMRKKLQVTPEKNKKGV